MNSRMWVMESGIRVSGTRGPGSAKASAFSSGPTVRDTRANGLVGRLMVGVE